MSKILLYTVQEEGAVGKRKQEYDESSMADRYGLTTHLGYKPYFCTKIEDSIADTWFKIWAASPGCQEEIIMFAIDEKDCVPMNCVDWTNHFKHMNDMAFNTILRKEDTLMTDYLIKEIPDDCIRISIGSLGEHIVRGFAEMSMPKPDYEEYSKSIDEHVSELSGLIQYADLRFTNGEIVEKSVVTYERVYGMMRVSGLLAMAVECSKLILNKNLNKDLNKNLNEEDMIPFWLTFIKPLYMANPALERAQNLLDLWDNSMSDERITFTYEKFYEMHDEFIKALDSATTLVVNERARKSGIERNTKCPCCSSKKYKQCHGKLSKFNEWLENPILVG